MRFVLLFMGFLASAAVMAEPVDFTLPDIEGKQRSLSEFRGKWVIVNFWATWCPPCLEEIPDLIDFHDRLKSVSQGYASMDYEPGGYAAADLVKLDILVHGEAVEAFSSIIHRSKATARGRQICKQLKEIIPICSHCRKLRDDDGFWHQVEAYFSAHTSSAFSHGICPGCMEKYYPEYANKKPHKEG